MGDVVIRHGATFTSCTLVTQTPVCVWVSVGSICPSVRQEQKKLMLKRDDQESVRTVQLRDPHAAQVGVSVFACVCVCVSLGT